MQILCLKPLIQNYENNNITMTSVNIQCHITIGERRETFRCPTGEDVYHQCKAMPQPRNSTDLNKELEMCDERIQVYFVDI